MPGILVTRMLKSRLSPQILGATALLGTRTAHFY